MHTKYRAAAPRLDHRLLNEGEDESLVQRLGRGIAETGLDCGCDEAANEMLDRVGAEEYPVRGAAGLANARKMRDALILVITLFGELTPDEPDRNAFHEIAGLFQDVVDFASFGVAAARQAGGEGAS